MRQQAGRYPRLNADEEIELGRTIQQWQQWPGGPDQAPRHVRSEGRKALDRFVLCNQRLAIHVGKLYSGSGVELDDLVMAATEGLIKAYKRFDPTLGYRSGSYAIWWAKQAVQRLIHQQSLPVRLPATAFAQLRKVLKAQDQLTKRQGSFTKAELAEEIDLTPEELDAILKQFHEVRAIRLERGSSDEAGTLPESCLADDPEAAAARHRRLLGASFAEQIHRSPALCPQQSRVLRLLYLEDGPISHRTVASKLNCSPARIRELESRGLEILRAG